MNTNFIFIIPFVNAYLFTFWEFVSGKPFQVHNAHIKNGNLILQVSAYFNPEELHQYFRAHIGKQLIEEVGEFKFAPVPKKGERKQHELVNIEKKLLQQIEEP